MMTDLAGIVKPLVWRDEFMRWSGNSFTATTAGIGCTYIIAASLDEPNVENVIASKKAAAQADYEVRILSAIDADKIARLVEAAGDFMDAVFDEYENGDRKLVITGPTANLKWLIESQDELRTALAEWEARK